MRATSHSDREHDESGSDRVHERRQEDPLERYREDERTDGDDPTERAGLPVSGRQERRDQDAKRETDHERPGSRRREWRDDRRKH